MAAVLPTRLAALVSERDAFLNAPKQHTTEQDMNKLLKHIRTRRQSPRRDPALTMALGKQWLLGNRELGTDVESNASLIRSDGAGLKDIERYDCVEIVAVAAVHCGDLVFARACLRHLQVQLGFASVADSSRLRRLGYLIIEAASEEKSRNGQDQDKQKSAAVDGATAALRELDATLGAALETDGGDMVAIRRRVAVRAQLDVLQRARSSATTQDEGAVAHLRKLVDIVGTDTEAWLELADMLISGHVSGYFAPDEAAFCVEEVIAANPYAWHVFCLHGEIAYAAAVPATGAVDNQRLLVARKAFAHSTLLLVRAAQADAEVTGAQALLRSVRPLYCLLQVTQRMHTPQRSGHGDEENTRLYDWARELLLKHYTKSGDHLQEQVFTAAYPAQL